MVTPYQTGDRLPPDVFRRIRRRAIFEYCKWDPQVGDVEVLADFPLYLDPAAWQTIRTAAGRMAREVLAAEEEIGRSPALLRRLNLPRPIRRILEQRMHHAPPPGVARLIRFDFHYTPDGWKISEANTDVPGGFVEASGFARLVQEHCPGTTLCGDPTAALADALAAGGRTGDVVALVHATAYSDDRQVMEHIGKALTERGRVAVPVAPDLVRWNGTSAWVDTATGPARVGRIVRFYPAEWMINLPRRSQWPHFFGHPSIPMCNPGTVLVTQTKRFPLVWDSLSNSMETWRSYLPEVRPFDRRLGGSPDWVIKPAYGRVGEGVGIAGVTEEKEWRRIQRAARRNPEDWILQRRFRVDSVPSPAGEVYVCIGVYTVDGCPAGAYGRIARKPLTDSEAKDIAVLMKCETAPCDFESGRMKNRKVYEQQMSLLQNPDGRRGRRPSHRGDRRLLMNREGPRPRGPFAGGVLQEPQMSTDVVEEESRKT